MVRLPVCPKLADDTGYSTWITEVGFGQSHRHIFDGSGAGLEDTCAAVRFPRGFRQVSEREPSPTEEPRDDSAALARPSMMCSLRIQHLPAANSSRIVMHWKREIHPTIDSEPKDDVEDGRT